jgi:polyisoprenoid-binding protein YceI
MSRLAPAATLLGAALFCLSPLAATAEERTLVLDPERTELSFELGATGHDVHGILHVTGGTVHFDPATGAASGDIAIDARLTETGNAKRDKTMHKKVLESEGHPLIVFHAERIEGEVALAGDSEFDLVGTVELLGVPHPLTLHTVASVTDGEVAATTTFPVPYIEWGLHDPSMMMLRVAKVVQVSVEAHGRLDGATVPTSAAP